MTDKELEKLVEDMRKYCPNCGGKDFWTDYSNFSQDNGRTTSECCSCGWRGRWEDMENKGEFTDKKRVELIDKMLNGQTSL